MFSSLFYFTYIWVYKAMESYMYIYIREREREMEIYVHRDIHIYVYRNPCISFTFAHGLFYQSFPLPCLLLGLSFKSLKAPMAQWFSTVLSPGYDPGDLGRSPMSGSLHGTCFSLGLSLSLSVMNK